MSNSVERLKELLFDRESEKLTEIDRRLDTVFERAGTDERFSSSVADVLDRALRKAEVDRHAELADAIAPLVVRTVKTEIRNSRDELVEALYPVTGRMVKAYVASALKDLADEINRRLEANPVMLRLRSLSSGKSVAEIAMAEAQRLRIDELYLVGRGTGELIGRWPEATDGDASRDQVMSGILTALNEFSSEALRDEGSELRQIDLGGQQLYLRASQKFLLAAKCAGAAPAAVETILDEAFLSTLEALQADPRIERAESGTRPGELLSEVSTSLQDKIGIKQAEIARSSSGMSPLTLLAWIVGLPLALWLGWTLYANYQTERAHIIAARVVAETKGVKGYPTTIKVDRLGYAVTLSGLLPSAAVRSDLVDRLQRALPGTEVRDQMSILPSSLAEIQPEIEKVRSEVAGLEAEVEPEFEKVKRNLAGLDAFRSEIRPELVRLQQELSAIEVEAKRTAVVRAMDRATRRLDSSSGDLGRLIATIKAADAKAVVSRSMDTVSRARQDLATYRARAAGEGLKGLAELAPSFNAQTLKLRDAGAELSGLVAASLAQSYRTASPAAAVSSDVSESAEELAAETERLATLAITISQTLALKEATPAPQPPPAPVVVTKVKEPSAEERLSAWVRGHAIFFASNTTFRDAARAEKTMSELAEMMRTTDKLVRVVGYTDDRGGPDRNLPLSQARADAVKKALVDKGVPASRLVAIGRVDGNDLSPLTGEQSPNRRVEFEVGFEGEGGP